MFSFGGNAVFSGHCEELNRHKQLLSDSCTVFWISAGTGPEHAGENKVWKTKIES